jgi:hypothetical protein
MHASSGERACRSIARCSKSTATNMPASPRAMIMIILIMIMISIIDLLFSRDHDHAFSGPEFIVRMRIN